MSLLRFIRYLPFVSNYITSRSQRILTLQAQNRPRILSLYRYFYKTIPPLYVRQIQKIAKLQELRMIFKNGKPLINEREINMKIEFGEQIKQKIASGEWKGLPEYQSATFDTSQTDLDMVMRQQTTKLDLFRDKFRLKW